MLATLVIFLIANTVPGDPAMAALGDMQASDPVQVREFRARWGLDLPLWEQYWLFLKRLAQGDLGISIAYFPAPVTEVFGTGLLWTMLLAGGSLVVAFCLGTALGALAGRAAKNGVSTSGRCWRWMRWINC